MKRRVFECPACGYCQIKGPPITPTELKIINQIMLGLSIKEMARNLGMAHRTAKFHVSSIAHKFEVHSGRDYRTQIAWRWVSPLFQAGLKSLGMIK